MPDRFKVPGFDDSAPNQLPTRRGQEDAFAQAAASDDARVRNDILVDRRLFALKDTIAELHGDLASLKVAHDGMVKKVDTIDANMATNNEMTEKILAAVSGGKMVLGAIKLLGAIAVPISALIALWYSFTHGGAPPHP